MSNEQKKIGAFIAELRKKRGMTQSDLAKVLKTSQPAVARIERGEQNMSLVTLKKISTALHSPIVKLSSGGMNFQIHGGRELKGEVVISTSKNAAVGLLCASLLNKGKTTLKRVPKIEEVYRIIEVLESIGVSVKWLKGNDIEITPPKKLAISKLDVKAGRRTRSIIMFMGPLMHLMNEFKLPYAGGCKLGTRTVRPHMYALEELGLKVDTKDNYYHAKVARRSAGEIVMYESGDTATENAIMAAAKMDGITTIKFASANYMVQDVCFFLEKLGVKIEGIGTATLTIHGKPEINEDVVYEPAEDPIEAMSFLAAAIVTKSEIKIKRCPIDFLELELLKLEKMGFKYKMSKRYYADNARTELVDITTKKSKLKALKEKLSARVYPGINMDNLPFFVPIAAMAEGRTLIHDYNYENRAIYYTDLAKVGANVQLIDIHRAYVDGPTEWKPVEHICPPALRPAVLILLGMLAAPGTSLLRNVYSINRGYEGLADKLNKLGANIEILSDL
ncbi:UDP-N-acetylglucosamine 1-carboxyvinyltransferase [Candidatus Uhrbacteria bacterium]|jgi:UDP-N-acetylglucosamine 1-carboxyvinyltransferase|nr:UDP-N-acetylglucosamine 1-carboxyvinyltransferase [Candidatus Uhrbacteria bacterium]